MKKIFIFISFGFLMFSSCNDELDLDPKAILSEDQISTPQDAERFVIAAYSELGNDEINRPFSLWPYGNVRSDDAYKGGRDPGDGQHFHFTETFTNLTPNISFFDELWFHLYVGVRRANEGLRIMENFTDDDYPAKQTRIGELRFIRGHFYFELKKLFNRIPYLDENTDPATYKDVTNVEFTSDELWDKIASDFEFASEVLPQVQPQVGRADQIAAFAYLAKTRLYQAYEKGETHQVTGINTAHLQEVIAAADKVLASDHALQSDYANNFLPGPFENGVESVFAVQFSKDDGTTNGRLNFGDMLTVPQGIGCCDFQKPSQNLVNAFRTDENGLPLFDTFNQNNVDFANNTVDPRLDHTVSRPGNPWKYQTDLIVEENWSRAPQIYGTFNSLKENVSPDDPGFTNVDPFYGNTKTRVILRYADVMLFKAEALIELGQQDQALPLINALRERAASSTTRLVNADGIALANYELEPYQPGVNIEWTQANARKALRFERRMELSLEGHRFFDLLRWGVAGPVLNQYFSIEQTRRAHLQSASFAIGTHEYLPIPQNQIFFSENKYVQNPGY